MQLINLTGKRYGHLVVLERDYEYQYSHNYDKPYWKCRCDCGKVKTISGKSLRNGSTISCGCQAKNRAKLINFEDITGQKFGKLTAIEYIDGSKWLCKCECGSTTIVNTNHLKSGHTISCGCIHSKGEYLITKWLNEHNIKFKKEYTNNELRNSNGNIIRIDFALLDLNNNPFYFIEYNGSQHYNLNDPWYKESVVDGLVKKQEYAKIHNIPFLIIKYDEDIITILNHIDFSEVKE